jgi:glycosyltransferase involved in cell wall biosynthesis
MGQGIHDQRFVSCASENGWMVTALRCDGKNYVDLVGADSFRWIGNLELISSNNEERFKSEFLKVVELVKPDLIQVGPLSSAAAVLSEDLNVPVLSVSWSQDLLYDIHESDWSKQVAVSAMRMSNHLLTDCTTVRDVAVQYGAPDVSISTVPWGVDLDHFCFSARNSRIDLLSIVSLRNLEPLYSVSVLLEALGKPSLNKHLSRINSVIAGTGSEEYSLKCSAVAFGLEHTIDFVGFIPEPDLPNELLKHDLYVSTSPVDGSSISMLQAMALGLPCLVPDIPSNREWIEHGFNGLLYESRNSEALAESLKGVVLDSSGLASLAFNARATVENRADWRIGKKSLARIYDQVIL